MSLLAALLRDAGAPTGKNTVSGRIFGAQPVEHSADLERIKQLPQRRWQDNVVDVYSERFRKVPTAQLYPMQAAALAELETLGTANIVASLGEGKTLVTALAPLVVGAKRPLFLNYQRLIDKTVREFRDLADEWQICHTYTFLSVEKLSRDSYHDYLERMQFDFICIDEAHSLQNPDGPRFRRLRRFKEANPSVPVLPLTATPGVDLEQYAHVQALLLGERSPLPHDDFTLREWGEALNVDVRGQRRPLGALVQLSDGGQSLEEVREAVGRRIEQTPGNIYSRSAESIDCSIYCTDRKLELPDCLHTMIASAWSDVLLPDGRCFEELYNKQLILKQLGAGYAKVLDPAPPDEWRDARSLWSSFVREIISNETRYGLDTPAQVKAAVRSGEIDDGGRLEWWCQLAPTFVPSTKTEWFDLSVLRVAVDWLAEERGLVWVTQPTVGRKLAELSGLPFFHANGCDEHVGSIEGYKCKTGAILAVRPNMLGRNLQRWHKNLYITPPSSSIELDQSIGRTARRGQRAPTVEVIFLLTVWEHWASLQTARRAAEAERTLGKNASSRLLLSDWCVSDLHTVKSWKGPCWKR